MNYFNPKATAERYVKGRSYFHENTIQQVQHKLDLPDGFKFNKVLDVACGTGLSSKALKGIAEEIVATDSSEEMLRHARQIPGIEFVHSVAEAHPFGNAEFDMITVCSGVH